jgi:threonine/homoserine/homoserine lactone efflux protein
MTRPVYHLAVAWTQVVIVLAFALYATLAGTWASWFHVIPVACICAWLLYRAVQLTRQHVRDLRDIEAARQMYAEQRARHFATYEARRARDVELRPWPRPRPLPPVT